MTTDNDRDRHGEQTERLWRAIRRDLGSAILFMAGFTKHESAMTRLTKNWARLCDPDLDVATSLWHGVEQIHIMMDRRDSSNSPPARREAQWHQVLGLAEIAREHHPTRPSRRSASY